MSNTVNPYEQALVAVLAEANSNGQDVDKLVEQANAGIMGNKPYTWVGAEYKPAVLSALKVAAEQAKQ